MTQAMLITASRAVQGLTPDGAVPTQLEHLAQRAVDDVRAQVERVSGLYDPAWVVVDVRVSCFVPPVAGRHGATS